MTDPERIQGNLTPEQQEAIEQLVMAMQRLPHFWVLNAEGEPQPATDPFTDPFALMAMIQDPRRQVERTTICAGVVVSTVFLFTDHAFGMSDRPVLWETMVFDERPRFEMEGDGLQHPANFNGHSARYSSLEDAIAGHKRIVAMVRDVL